MHSSALLTLRIAAGRAKSSPCRFIVGRRFPIPKRLFHLEQRRRQQNEPAEPSDVPETAQNLVADQISPSQPAESQESEPEETESLNGAPPNLPSSKDPSPYGSASRRAFRNVKRPPISPPQLPSWFIDRNVTLREDNIMDPAELHRRGAQPPTRERALGRIRMLRRVLTMIDEKIDKMGEQVFDSEFKGLERVDLQFLRRLKTKFDSGDGNTLKSEALYTIEVSVYMEVRRMISAGLNIPRDPDNASSSRPHLILNCPQEGSTFFLDFLVQHLALSSETDLVRIDAQDVAEIGGRYLRDLTDLHGNTLSVLGYETYTRSPREAQEDDDAALDEMDDEEEDDRRRPRPRIFQRLIPIQLRPGKESESILKSLAGFAGMVPEKLPGQFTSQSSIAEATKDSRLSLFIDALLTATEVKRKSKPTLTSSNPTANAEDANGDPPTSSSDHNSGDSKSATSSSPDDNIATFSETQDPNSTPNAPRKLIIHIRDYHEIKSSPNGSRILEKLHEIVQRKRGEGQRILIIGTTATGDLLPSRSESGLRHVQSDQSNTFTRTIVTPSIAPSAETQFAAEGKERTGEINLRHIRDMLRQISPDPFQTNALVSKTNINMDSRNFRSSGLEKSVWSMDRVHRVVTLALGKLKENQEMRVQDIEGALHLIGRSDNSKIRFLTKENVHDEGSSSSHDRDPKSSPIEIEVPQVDAEERMKKIRNMCNNREKKFLHGVIDPSAIRTTFADVRAPPETIEALKTLTSLSLVRPDAFTYGVLATDRIPGVLLYGPPGTGKTLLAKAVAKESGATMLEVSGSDMYDMYVGEGEKNIRAIFALAKKLTPCVMFIDEADAILGSRGSSESRTSHRELINQFLREWDGMTDMGAFIMVATNRPFDLDEASLRRLPRRLLVDLPTEKDREAILGIHLKDELLAEDVSLFTLAAQTPFYSGSDLKNLAVAAALACVREEIEVATAAKSKFDPPDSDPVSPSLSPPLDIPDQERKLESEKNTDQETSPDQEKNLDQEKSPEHEESRDPENNTDQEKKPEPYKYPAKRTLQLRHFDRALEEISASISDSMSSLSAIRKFDEKYGDRKGRKKRVGGYGFGTVTEKEKGDAGARVRSLS